MRGERQFVKTIFLTTDGNLARAFDLPRGVTALVGGGGKTTLMLRLARELAGAGENVIVTTTTHIFPPEGIVTLTDASETEVKGALASEKLICLGTPASNGKLAAPGIAINVLTEFADYVLVEADGAKQLPLKAPAEHEPVLPEQTRLVIAVVGLDGAGMPIRNTAFRPERYAALTGKNADDTATARDIARVLTHPDGQRKGVTNDMRFSVLLNKADGASEKMTAVEIAAELWKYPVERVIVAALGGNDTIPAHSAKARKTL